MANVSPETQLTPARKFGFHPRLVRGLVAGTLCLHLFLFLSVRQRIARAYPDFTIFYTAGELLREGAGGQLYEPQAQLRVQEKLAEIPHRRGPLPYNHPPFEAVIFVPLALLPYEWAFAVWNALNLVLLAAVVLRLQRSVGMLRLIPAWECTLGLLAFFPVFACLLQGQDSILQLSLCTAGFLALKRESDVAAGCWFALALLKPQFIVPLVLLLVLWKRSRMLIGFIPASIGLALVSAALVGWRELALYPAYVLRGTQPGVFGAVPPELMANLRGLALGLPSVIPRPEGLVLLVLASSLLLVLAAILGRKNIKPQTLGLQFSLGIAVSILVSGHANAHDYCLLVLAMVLIGDYSLRFAATEPRRTLALFVPLVPILISPLWLVLLLAWGHENLMALPLLWWTWTIGKELSRGSPSPAFQAVG
ncbi:MAG TPA: glycosyltransferase family 87 protein [Candidatus Aquilonibacter sp.]|nr:glycosyltransferase family 87 protein [Candidatus Aquilonibacter sp.]